MAINFNILSPTKMPDPIEIQGGGSSDGGMEELFSGIQGLIGGFSGGNKATPVSSPTAGMGTNTLNQAFNVAKPPQQSMQGQLQQQTTLGGGMNDIFKNAQSQVGLREGNPVLSQYLQKANPNLDPSTTPWCAGFVGSVLNASGLKGTNSLMAKSYLNYGKPTTTPSVGDIVVLNRGSDPNLGHVGFFAGTDKNGYIKVLGGNQGDSVSIKSFPSTLVAGYRQPPTGQEVQQFAKQNNINNPTQLANVTQQYHPELKATVSGIVNVESGGAKDPFSVVSKPSRNGDRAYGYSQIMGSNIPSWTKEALGTPMTPEQYLQDRDAQQKTTEYHINKLLQKYNDPRDVASAWFTGRPLNKVKGNPRDAYGTSNSEYQDKFNKGYLKAREEQTVNSEPTMQTSYNTPQQPIQPMQQDPNLINPPSIDPVKYNDVVRQLDQGHDDYSQKKGINWNLLQLAQAGQGQQA